MQLQILTTVLARYFDLRLSTGLFRNTSAIQSFLEYYAKFDFLEPKNIGKYGLPVHESQKYNPRGPEWERRCDAADVGSHARMSAGTVP